MPIIDIDGVAVRGGRKWLESTTMAPSCAGITRTDLLHGSGSGQRRSAGAVIA
jgi:hypothetical protein